MDAPQLEAQREPVDQERHDREYAQFVTLRELRSRLEATTPGTRDHKLAFFSWYQYRSTIFDEHKNLISDVLRKWRLRPTDDRVQEGAIGLLKAIDGCNPEYLKSNNVFSTFAYRCIQNRYNLELTYNNALKRKGFTKSLDVPVVVAEGAQTGRTNPGIHIDPDPGVHVWRRTTLAELLPDTVGNEPDREAIIKDTRAYVDELLRYLPSRYKDVLRMRFGDETSDGKTLDEIGQKLKVTKERVRQIEARGLSKLRTIIEGGKNVSLVPISPAEPLEGNSHTHAVSVARFGPTIHEACVMLGMPQSELARRVGCSRKTFSFVLNGHHKRNISVPKRFAEVLGISIDEFINLDSRSLARQIVEKILLLSPEEPGRRNNSPSPEGGG